MNLKPFPSIRVKQPQQPSFKMKIQSLTPLAASLVLAGSLFTAQADDRQKTDDPRKARYLAAQRELSAAVKAGKISEADAKRRLSEYGKSLWAKEKAQGGGDANKANAERIAKYRHAEREIMSAVKAGKISEAEAKKKLASIKKSLSGECQGKTAQGQKAHGNERMAKYKAIEREIYGAVKAGKMSKEEAGKKLAHVKRELFGQAKQTDRRPTPKAGHGKPDQPKRISREQAEKMGREIAAAVKAGKLSREEAHQKFQAIRKMVGPTQSDRAPQARPDHHRKPATSDKRGSDRNLAAEVDALRREIHELKRTLEAIRRHHGDRRER